MTINEVSEKYNISHDTLRYYERVGMIPTVGRTPGGIRNYQEGDLNWVELAICMRSAGLPIEAMIEYVKLFQEGPTTYQARLQLLQEQLDVLLENRKKMDETISRLQYKVSKYQEAVVTGELVWDAPHSSDK